MSDNRQILIQALASLSELDGRYENIRCINFDPVRGAKQGCFSLVFRAHDRLEGRDVALKFFDVDPAVWVNIYRRQAFAREHDLLRGLVGKERCLQLVSALTIYPLTAAGPSGLPLTIPCEYFAVDWIEDPIDEYFERQHEFEVIDKLYLFNEIVLAVEALHRHHIFHRDLKPDNIRTYRKESTRIVVVIDLGTAALHGSTPLGLDYVQPVGARAYSPPEAYCHLAGEREIAPFADVYALGCMLFQLFNFGLFVHAYANRNPKYGLFLAAMESALRGAKNAGEKMRSWRQNIGRLSAGLGCPNIDGPGSSVPPGIAGILNMALDNLTRPDFRQRTSDLERVRRYIWSAIRGIENEKEYQRRLAFVRERRRRREEKLRLREQRFLRQTKGT